MYCNKCKEDVANDKLLKHLRDYHCGEKDLEISCPACGTFYNNGGSFQKHWYSKHHSPKRKSSEQSESTISKKFVSEVTVSVESSATQVTEIRNVLVGTSSASHEFNVTTDAKDVSSENFHVSDKTIVEEKVANASNSVVEIPEVHDEVHQATSASHEVEVPTDTSDMDILSSDNVASDSDSEKSESDAESEVGMDVDEAVKLVLPQKDSPSVNEEAASYLLNLNASCNIPGTKIDLIIGETEKIVKSSVLNFASKVNEKLKNSNLALDQLIDVNAASESVSKVFDNIRTVKQQKKHFKEVLGVVEPKPVPLGSVLTKVRRKGRVKTVVKQETMMLIPLEETVDQLLSHPDYESLVHSKRVSDYLDVYLKGKKCKSNPVLVEHPDALRFILYYDDVEVCAPLKSKAGKHKLGAFYLLLDNICLEHRSNLSMIFLVALVNTNFVKDQKYGIDAALEIVVNELKKFEKGVVLPSGKKVYGTLIATIGDNLSAHQVGGFKEGFTAHCCCRYCMATYEQCQKMVREDPKLAP